MAKRAKMTEGERLMCKTHHTTVEIVRKHWRRETETADRALARAWEKGACEIAECHRTKRAPMLNPYRRSRK